MTATNRGTLVFLSTTSFAVWTVVTKYLDPQLPTLTLTAWELVVAAVNIHGLSLWRGETVGQVEWTA